MTSATLLAQSNSGAIMSSSNVSYAAARAGGTFTVNDGSTFRKIGQNFSTPTYECDIVLVEFDTSSIPVGATVSAAVLSLWSFFKEAAQAFTIEARLYDYGASITSGDWLDGTTLASKTLLASISTASLPADDTAYLSLTDVAFPANINKGGTTRIVICSSRQSGNNSPTATLEDFYAYVVHATKGIKLDVTYTSTPPSSATPTPSTNIGRLTSSSNVDYATARSGGGTLAVDTTANTYHQVGQSFSTPTYQVYEVMVEWDTSAIGASDTVNSVAVSSWCFYDDSGTDFTLQLRANDFGAAPVTTGDYIAGASLSAKTLLAHLSTSGMASGAYVSWTDDAFAANVTKAGTTRAVLCSDRTVSGTSPTGAESVYLYINHATQGLKLTINYTPAGGAAISIALVPVQVYVYVPVGASVTGDPPAAVSGTGRYQRRRLLLG